MTPDDQQRISAAISEAESLATGRADAGAAQAFALARELVVSLADPAALDRHVANHDAPLVREREQYRTLIAQQRSGERTLLILGDSLGLPRPDDKQGAAAGAERTYPMLFLELLPGHTVDSYCQRYWSTDDIVALLAADREVGAHADVVVHIGLNDCANRMFLERERLALDLVDADVKERIVGFAQKHRRLILAHLPSRHYVDIDRFRANLDTICATLRGRGARRVLLTTVVLPPVRFWPATPGVQANFALYNLTMMQAAQRNGAVLFDLDRLVWAHQHEDVLLADGMHLSHAGHRLFADQASALIRA